MAGAGSEVDSAVRAARCSERIRALYGEDLTGSPPVLQPMAVWADGTGRLFTLRIGPASPASATDRFVLGIARARVDAILTTGRILRDEPGVRHDHADEEGDEEADEEADGEGGRGDAADLAAWRAERCGRPLPPTSVVLTRRPDLDLAHPLFTAAAVIVVTGEEAAAAIRSRAPAHVEVVGRARTDLRETLRWLREARGFASVSVEAGPATSLGLYSEPVLVDELMLSVFEGPTLPAAARGGAFLDVADVDRLFPMGRARRSECTRGEESGPWSFCRFSWRS